MPSFRFFYSVLKWISLCRTQQSLHIDNWRFFFYFANFLFSALSSQSLVWFFQIFRISHNFWPKTAFLQCKLNNTREKNQKIVIWFEWRFRIFVWIFLSVKKNVFYVSIQFQISCARCFVSLFSILFRLLYPSLSLSLSHSLSRCL